jgi:hypothetical protein
MSEKKMDWAISSQVSWKQEKGSTTRETSLRLHHENRQRADG